LDGNGLAAPQLKKEQTNQILTPAIAIAIFTNKF
jgi:hypothetical protein